MTSQTIIKSPAIALSLVLAVVAVLIAPQAFSKTGVFAGYGYGDDCVVEGPSVLNSSLLKKPNQGKIRFTWEEVSFDECEGDSLDYYQLQIKHPNGSLVESWTDISGLEKTILLRTIKKNKAYVFRVRAWSELGEKSTWSLYTTFRTKPSRPRSISITKVESTSVTATWPNVIRSNQLAKYRVVLKRGQKTIAKANVRKRLKKSRAEVAITGLESDKKYTIQVRSVYSKSLRSKYKSKKFWTPAE